MKALLFLIAFMTNGIGFAAAACPSRVDGYKVSIRPENLRRCGAGEISWLESVRSFQKQPLNSWQGLLTKIHELKTSYPANEWTFARYGDPTRMYNVFPSPDQQFLDVLDSFSAEYPQGAEFDVTPTPVRDSDSPFFALRMDIDGDGQEDLVRFGSTGQFQGESVKLERAKVIRDLLKNFNGVFTPTERDGVSVLDLLNSQVGKNADLFWLTPDMPGQAHPALRMGDTYANFGPIGGSCVKDEELPVYQQVARLIEQNSFLIQTYRTRVDCASFRDAVGINVGVHDDPRFTRGVVINLGRKPGDKHRFWTQPLLFASENFSGQGALFFRRDQGRLLIYSQAGTFFQNSRQIDVFSIPTDALLAQANLDKIEKLQPVTSFTLQGGPDMGLLRKLELTDEGLVRATYQIKVGKDSHLIRTLYVTRPFLKDGTF